MQTKSDLLEQLVGSLLAPSALLQADKQLVLDLSATGNKQCEHMLLIGCEIFTHLRISNLPSQESQDCASK